LTAYSLRARAGFLSHRQRSWDSPFGAFSSRKVSAAFASGRTHIPFHPSVLPPSKRWAGPNGPRFLGFDPSRSPSRPDGFNSLTAGCSLGLRPSRVFRLEPCRAFRPGSSLALPQTPTSRPTPPAPRSISQLQPGSVRVGRQAARADRTTLVGFGTCPIRSMRAACRPGLLLRLVPRRTSPPTDQHSLDSKPRSTGVAQDRRWCRASRDLCVAP
jgi:hypothetical protein